MTDYSIKILNKKVDAKINENITNKDFQVQKSQNNSFEMKKCNTTVHQMKINKHRCYDIAATYKTKKNSMVNLI